MSKKINKFVLIFLLFVSSINMYGCVVVAAGAGSAVTYSVATDSVKDKVKYSKETIVENFIEIIRDEKGRILYVSISEGRVKAELDKKVVFLMVKESKDNFTDLKISARKGYNLLPDKEEALRVYKRLIEKLK